MSSLGEAGAAGEAGVSGLADTAAGITAGRNGGGLAVGGLEVGGLADGAPIGVSGRGVNGWDVAAVPAVADVQPRSRGGMLLAPPPRPMA